MNLKTVLSTTGFLSFITLISIFNVARANEQTIATITTDSGLKTYKLVIDSNDGRGIKNFYKDVYENGSKVKREILNASALKTGVTLEQRDKYVVMSLRSDNFDLEQGGQVTVDTLYNGATGERRGYDLQIAQNSKGWAIFKHNKTISRINIQTNKVMIIGDVGIKNLIMN